MERWLLNGAAEILPFDLRRALEKLNPEDEPLTEELRLRRGYPMFINRAETEVETDSPPITEHHLRSVLENASQASAHTVLDRVRQGFVTLKGGHRIGLCGTVVRKDGGILNMKFLTSVSVRVARQISGPAEELVPKLMNGESVHSTLILAPPGAGKTTLLRDMIRVLSDTGVRVAVADERGELGALWNGMPQFDVGRHTDVLDGCPKGEGMSILLRGMNPQVIAVDEITQPEDVQAVREVNGCGVSILASAHGESLRDLERRPVYRALLEEGVFRRVILITRQGICRRMTVEVLS